MLVLKNNGLSLRCELNFNLCKLCIVLITNVAPLSRGLKKQELDGIGSLYMGKIKARNTSHFVISAMTRMDLLALSFNLLNI